MDLFNSTKTLIESEQIQVDNNVFKLHYKVTVILLVACSILLTSKQYFGDPIDCDVESRKDLINTFCWIFGTFTVKDNREYPLPGLGIPNVKNFENLDLSHIGTMGENSPFSKQTYYQWVCLVLLLQALLFYIPRYLWRTWEAGRIKLLLEDLKNPLIATSWGNDKKVALAKYIVESRNIHNIYTIRYCFCEALNLINVIFQIFVMNWFFSGSFSPYGLKPSSYQHLNPLNTIFPKMAKCTYFRYGASGGVESRDALCILPLNILNEKVFLVLWYWLFFLLTISFFCLVYRCLFLFVPCFRVYLLRALTRKLDDSKASFLVNKLSFGDFFVLYRIGKNVNPILFKDIITEFNDYIISMGSYKVYPCNEV